MTNEDFLALHPEFATAPDATLTAVLAAVELRVSDRWGTQRPEIVALTAAAQLAISPNGRAARLSYETKSSGMQASVPTSTYAVRLAELKASLACGQGRLG